MNDAPGIYAEIEQDIWVWIREFVITKNEFYNHKFAPCPYARQAVISEKVDVVVWHSGEIFDFIKKNALSMINSHLTTTRVMAFPPKVQFRWGLNQLVEMLNMDLVSENVFLNTGVAKTTISKYPSSSKEPYFIVVANTLDAVLAGAEALKRTEYYKNWPAAHYAHVVERRARMAKQYGKK